MHWTGLARHAWAWFLTLPALLASVVVMSKARTLIIGKYDARVFAGWIIPHGKPEWIYR
jgi:hypothetical protein